MNAATIKPLKSAGRKSSTVGKYHLLMEFIKTENVKQKLEEKSNKETTKFANVANVMLTAANAIDRHL